MRGRAGVVPLGGMKSCFVPLTSQSLASVWVTVGLLSSHPAQWGDAPKGIGNTHQDCESGYLAGALNFRQPQLPACKRPACRRERPQPAGPLPQKERKRNRQGGTQIHISNVLPSKQALSNVSSQLQVCRGQRGIKEAWPPSCPPEEPCSPRGGQPRRLRRLVHWQQGEQDGGDPLSLQLPRPESSPSLISFTSSGRASSYRFYSLRKSHSSDAVLAEFLYHYF